MTDSSATTNPNTQNSNTTNNTLRNHLIPVKVVFLIGRHVYDPYLGNETEIRLQNEIKDYGDILQEDFLDTYNNLTIKSVMMLKWIVGNQCYDKFKFLVKCDDDSFINIPNLLHYLLGGTLPLYNSTVSMYDEKSYKVLNERNRLQQASRLLIGFKFCNSKPLGDVSSKWYMPYYMFMNDTYPNYLSGGSYILSSDIVLDLYTSALNSSLIYLEDIFITGISAEHAGIRRQHNPLFLFNYSRNKCVLRGVLQSTTSKS
uniref:Hexosyltransferase n=1 Tax=Megaselia scalaris TaxID=36166 RepID=T1GJU5_MEGSC